MRLTIGDVDLACSLVWRVKEKNMRKIANIIFPVLMLNGCNGQSTRQQQVHTITQQRNALIEIHTKTTLMMKAVALNHDCSVQHIDAATGMSNQTYCYNEIKYLTQSFQRSNPQCNFNGVSQEQ